MRPISVNLVTAIGILSLVAGSAVFADAISLKAELNAVKEVPPNASKGGGAVSATLDTVSKKLSWKITYPGLTADPTVAHFYGPRIQVATHP